jgi:branched-chain amino acid transport system substrate-binding protein
MKVSGNSYMRFLKFLFPVFLVTVLPYYVVCGVQPFPGNELKGDTVKIGLLISDNKSPSARQGAAIAVRTANQNGGCNGHPVRLVVRSMEGPWGTGSKETVNLIFDEKVWAIIGSHYGRNAHLAEQVATKERIVFLSAWAADPTLSQAFVPWFFNCVPNNLQQADLLIHEIFTKRKFSKVALVGDDGYDSKLAISSFLKTAKTKGVPVPALFSYDNQNQDFTSIIDELDKAGSEAIILFGLPRSSIKIIDQMRHRKMSRQVFGALSLLDEKELSEMELKKYEGVVLITPGHWLSAGGSAFIDEYQSTYGTMPGAVAAYAFDGMNMIIEAVRKAGGDRDKIQKSLADLKFEGVTGTITFDAKGNRVNPGVLMEIKNGHPAAVE